MSRRTRRALLLALPAALAVGVVALWLLWPRTAITRENAAKIHKGMARADVDALLGGPPRDDRTGPVVDDEGEDEPDDGGRDGAARRQVRRYAHYVRQALRSFRGTRPPQWHSDEVTVSVYLDAEGRVTGWDAIPMRRADESRLDRLHRWLGL